MRTIYKYTLKPRCSFDLPQASEILSVGVQCDDIVMWVMMDPVVQKIKRNFVVYGTGHEIEDENLKFIGTVQMRYDPNGSWPDDPGFPNGFVFHVFEVKLG
jgi:hypothetical protein